MAHLLDFAAMRAPAVTAVSLMRHPESRSGSVRRVDARVSRHPEARLAITYSIEGDVTRVRLPPPRPPRIVHGLWQHTCCECFIALTGVPGYHEINFAPSGEWAAYAFEKYREGVPLMDEALNPKVAVRHAAGSLELDATIPLDRLSAVHACRTLALGLSAVVEDEQGMLSYWALKHPARKPDFHQREAFALEIDSVA